MALIGLTPKKAEAFGGVTCPESLASMANLAHCSIWVCLPGGFPSAACGPALAAFNSRMARMCPPLPPLPPCQALGAAGAAAAGLALGALTSEPYTARAAGRGLELVAECPAGFNKVIRNDDDRPSVYNQYAMCINADPSCVTYSGRGGEDINRSSCGDHRAANQELKNYIDIQFDGLGGSMDGTKRFYY